MQHEKWKNVIILGALRPPSPLGSMLDPVIMIEFMHLSALDFVRLSALENRITEAIFSPPKWSNSLDASVRIHTSEYVCVRLPTAFVTRGGGGWRPFLHLHVKWCFDDVLIFRCVPLSKNDQNFFGNFELFSPKTYTLKGSVSELSHIMEDV